MQIALDYDDTYTKDPSLWVKFIDNARDNGHTVVIVTARPDDNDNFDIDSCYAVLC